MNWDSDYHRNAIAEVLDRRLFGQRFLNRLRNISFLGILNTIIPGLDETPSRFDHTMGVTYLTLLYCKELQLPFDNTVLALLSALLHDIGHGPFSHVAESYLTMNSGYRANHETKVLENKFSSFIYEVYDYLPITIKDKYNEDQLTKMLHSIFRGD